MAASSLIKHSVLFFCLIVFSEAIRDTYSDNSGGVDGFSTPFFHRDSSLSPLYDSSLNHYQRLQNAFRRSISRSTTLTNRATASSSFAAVSLSTNNAIQAPITRDSGEFFMSLSIGTPPVEYVAIADTGSDLTWTQCLPCKECYNQSQPIFNPRRSSSYKVLPCSTDYCRDLEQSSCGSGKNICEYSYSYGDQSFTNGELALEKITFRSSSSSSSSKDRRRRRRQGKFAVEGTVIGCGHENGGTFDDAGSGIIGLGGGELSLVSQMSKISRISKQFSYCLAPTNLTTNINFGSKAIVTGRHVVKTPLVAKDPNTFYFLTLEAITIGKKRVPLIKSSSSPPHVAINGVNDDEDEGNIIIDSGTTLTFLPQVFYENIRNALEKAIKGKQVDDPTHFLDLCYATKNDGADVNIPVITVHFTGASVKLNPLNSFVMVAENVICLAFLPTTSLAIYGNIAQLNFLIGYDLQNRVLSFQPTTCA